VADISFHERLLGIASLREILTEHGPPTARLADFLGHNVKDTYDTPHGPPHFGATSAEMKESGGGQ
jgi:hypothetical protein